MNAEQLSKVGSDLVRRCGTRDPFQIANALGINVLDDCKNLGSLKGMYCIVKRNRFIFLNKDLSPQMKRIVCAHEIGHDRLHRALAKKHGLQEFMLYDMATKPEYEANIVAAEILLDSNEILEYIYDYGYTSEQIARAMHTDINLVALKIAHLAEIGHQASPDGVPQQLFEVKEVSMTKSDVMKEFLKKTVISVVVALFLFSMFSRIFIENGVPDYFLIWLACGVPFGMGKMFTLIPIGFGISGTVGVVALNLVLGGLIGGVILIWKLAVAIWYLPLTIYRLVT